MNLPWIDLAQTPLLAQAQQPSTTILLLDSQRQNADALAAAWLTAVLCQNNAKPCGHCQSCHLNQLDTHPDKHYYPEALKIDAVRDLLNTLHTTPALASKRAVYLGAIDRYHDAPINALLKTLEEPPTHSHFILSAASRRAVKPTILSRTISVSVAKASHQQALDWLVTQHNLDPEQATQRLFTHADDPFLAATEQQPPSPLTHLDTLIDFLSQPKSQTAYLLALEDIAADKTLAPNALLDYLSAQLKLLLHYCHYNSSPQGEQILYNAQQRVQALDIHRLHTLYAELSALRRPNRQQLDTLLSVKAVLLQTLDRRSLTL